MTNQRFSLSRLTIGGLLVLAACGASAQEAARNPNPFQAPQVAAAPSASASTPTLPPATTARSAADTGPLALPPPIPVPLEKMLPKLASQPAAPAASTVPIPPPPPASPAKKADDATAPTPSQAPSAGVVSPKVRAFLPREKIEASRARCQVTFKGRNLIQLTAGDAEQVIQMTGANGCLTAISADTDWMDVEYRGNNELMLMAQANTGKAARRGQVTVVTPNQTFVLTVRQAAEPSEPAIAPKEKAPAAEPPPAKVAAGALVNTTVPAEPEYDATKARLADVNDQPSQFTAALKSLASREPAVMPLSALTPLEAPMPAFTLVDIVEPKLELRSLAMLRQRAPSVVEDVPSMAAPTPQFELPDVRGAPMELKSLVALQKEVPPLLVRAEDLAPLPTPSFPLPDVAEPAQPSRSLAALRSQVPSVTILSADQLQRPAVPLSLPAIAAPIAKVAETTAPALVQEPTPSIDPARAKTIVDAVLSAAEPNFGEAPVQAPAKLAPARPAYVPPGYVTLDEYTPAPEAKPVTKDVPKPAKKRTK